MKFIETAREYLKRDAENLAPLTVRTYYWNLKKMEHYMGDVLCQEIDENYIREYRSYLQKKGDKPATVIKTLSVLRNYCLKMFNDGVIEKNPFDRIKVGTAYARRGYLTIRELKSLYLNFLDCQHILLESEREVMRAFLFSCFTGLRYSDLQSLDACEIFDWKIRKQMHKTGEAVYIPIPVQARLLLPPKLDKGKVFHVTENSHFNRTLRNAAKKLGYTKYVHCHIARHTFATTCITLGIPLHATSKLLGHRKLDTTLIYAKYVDTYLDKEMKKFNKLK